MIAYRDDAYTSVDAEGRLFVLAAVDPTPAGKFD